MLNSLSLMGWLMAEPLLRYTDGDAKPFIIFTIVSTANRKRADGSRIYEHISFKAYGSIAERFLRMVSVGESVIITGHIQSYTVVKKGKKRFYLELIVDDFYLDVHNYVDGKPVLMDMEALEEESDNG